MFLTCFNLAERFYGTLTYSTVLKLEFFEIWHDDNEVCVFIIGGFPIAVGNDVEEESVS
jgi:hypothetical protein